MLKTLNLYDTKAREVLPIIGSGEVVNLYCCGPTVYRDAHIGNMRTFLLADLIRRTLELNGLQVRVIQNITDVGHLAEDSEEVASLQDQSEGEDKIITAARSENLAPLAIARKYENEYHVDLAALNILPAEQYPRASDCIPLMQDLIAELLKRGNAYLSSDGSVYFDATSFPGYGEISGNRLDALKPGYRYEFTSESGKKFHADWVLWKAAGGRQEMIWDSPWGKGFPGWHIECSAMSMHFLVGKIDLHIGGIDLRFPHHENERAQSNSVTGNESVEHWIHGEHLLFEGRKMSKSAGNVLLLRDLHTRGIDPLALRLTFLENRYRSQMDLTWDSIISAQSTLKRWRILVNQSQELSVPWNDEIAHALNADLDTPKAIQLLRKIEKDAQVPLSEKVAAFLFADKVLALDLSRQNPVRPLPTELLNILENRAIARKNKNWQESDRLRDLLKAEGVLLKDSAAEQNWEWE